MQRMTYLIDSENVNDAWVKLLPRLERKDRIIIFYTENSPHFTVDSARIITDYKEKDITWKKCFAGRNALDFQLVSQMGYLISKYPQDSYAIMSNDTGFDAAVKYWTQEGVSVSRIRGNGKAVTGSMAEAVKERQHPGNQQSGENAGWKQPEREKSGASFSVSQAENINGAGNRPAGEPSARKGWFAKWFSASPEPAPMEVKGETVEEALASEANRKPGAGRRGKSKGGKRNAKYRENRRSEDMPKQQGKGAEAESAESREVQAPESREIPAARKQEVRGAKNREAQAVECRKVQASENREVQTPEDREMQTAKDREIQAAKPWRARSAENRNGVETPSEKRSITQQSVGDRLQYEEQHSTGDKPQYKEQQSPEEKLPFSERQVSEKSQQSPEQETSAGNRGQEIPAACVIGLCRSIPIRKQERIHEALVALLGGENGREVYHFLKEEKEFHEKLTTIYLEDKKARVDNYLKIVFDYNHVTLEQAEDIVRLLNKYSSRDLNGFYKAMTGCFGKERGSRYYSILKPHIRVIKKL